MITLTSNRLGDLADRIRQARARARDASVEAAAQSIDAGRLLVEAKAECPHGEWLLFLEAAEVPERQAQRLMQLARSGLKPDTVSDMGGIKAALEFMQSDLVRAWNRASVEERVEFIAWRIGHDITPEQADRIIARLERGVAA